MKIISPNTYISATTTTPFEIVLDKLFFANDSDVTVELETSIMEDFSSGSTTITPQKIIILATDPLIEVTDGTVSSAFKNNKIKIQHTWEAVEKKYLRVKVTQDNISYVSNVILLSTTTGSGVILSKTITKPFRPAYISFHDIYEMNNTSGSLTILVEVTNNALDTTPVWENATTAYLNKTPYAFTNLNKTAANYAVRVRITVNKISAPGSFKLYKMQFITT